MFIEQLDREEAAVGALDKTAKAKFGRIRELAAHESCHCYLVIYSFSSWWSVFVTFALPRF